LITDSLFEFLNRTTLAESEHGRDASRACMKIVSDSCDLDQRRAGNCSCVSGISCILQVTAQGATNWKNKAYAAARKHFSVRCNAAMRRSARSR